VGSSRSERLAGGGPGIAGRTVESALKPSPAVDADRWLAGVSIAIARGEWTDPARARVTVGDWSRQWLTAKAPSLKATTRESYQSILKTCIWPTWERVPLGAVTHGDVAAWVARLSAQMGASRCRKSAILLSGIMSACT
jgi:Phage integrase, N-terminal SAM-like domain